jgi:hypothetical protein
MKYVCISNGQDDFNPPAPVCLSIKRQIISQRYATSIWHIKKKNIFKKFGKLFPLDDIINIF